jgi:hypothetical protein
MVTEGAIAAEYVISRVSIGVRVFDYRERVGRKETWSCGQAP